MDETKKGWGGSRTGAGRKKTFHGRVYGFTSTLEAEKILESLDCSKTEFINAAIIHYHTFISRSK